MKRLIGLWALVLTTLLVACGGGGADQAPPAGSPNSAPVARAGADQSIAIGLQAVLDGTASSDPDGDAITYTWALAGVPAGSTATLVAPATSRPTLTPDRAGTYTLSLTVNDGKAASPAATMTVTATAPVAPQIVVNVAEPVSGSVQLSLSGTVTGAVTWYVDLQLLGPGGSGGGGERTWNTAQASNGPHLIVAHIQTAGSAFEEVRRTVTVSNSSVIMSASTSGTTGTINVDIRAASIFGITAVSATLDGADAGTLTAPNACSQLCSNAKDVYRFTVDAARVGSGSHTMAVTASDGAGSSRQITVAVPVSNAPALTLVTPLDGALVNGTLQVGGTTSSDKGGAVTVTAALGDVEFLRTTAASSTGSFNGSFSLTGLAPGAYTLLVRAIDSTNQGTVIRQAVVVTSTSGLAYAPLFTLPSGGRLLAVEGTKVLYDTADGSVVLRDLGSATDATLPGAAAIQGDTDWQISGGRVYMQGRGSDCASNFVCIYAWDTAGRLTNLSTANPFAGTSFQENPVAKGGYVIWTNGSSSYTLYDVASGSYSQINRPAGVNHVGDNLYDFAVVGGVVHFYFWGQTGGDGSTSIFDVYKWRSDTQASTRLTPGGERAIYPQTDGVRAAWQRAPVGGNADGTFALMTVPLAGGPATAASISASSFILNDGVLAWKESIGASRSVKASTAGTTTTLSVLDTATLYANGGGHVIYGQDRKVYSWNSASGAVTLRLETMPFQLMVDGSVMLFTVGTTVYRVAL